MKRLIFTLFGIGMAFYTIAQTIPNFIIKNTGFKKDTLSIVTMGAQANGNFVNTIAINNAIQKMHQKGGGVVVIPKGQWLTGPLVLLSNVNLHLNKGALVIFTSDFAQYPLVISSFEGVDAARCQSPISAENQNNIAITGEGIFDGNGLFWRPIKKDKLSEDEWRRHLKNYGGALTEDKKTWYPSKAAVEASTKKDIGKLTAGKSLQDFEGIKDFLRPNMLRISKCDQVLVEGVTFENSPAWTTHFLMSKNLVIKKMVVKNPWWGTNTDAIDLESCSNAILEDCVFDTGDDGITIKSGRDEDGRKRGMPTQNIIVKNCTVYHAHGGFVVGSEMSGGAKNIYIDGCSFIGTDIGLRFKTVRGRGGVVENIYAKNIRMKDIVGEAILFDMYYAATDPIKINGEEDKVVVQKFPVTEATPIFRNFNIENVICDGASKALFVRGIPEMPIKNITIKNSFIRSREGIQMEEADSISIKNSTILTTASTPMLKTIHAQHIDIDTIQLKKLIPTIATSMAEKMAATSIRIWPDSFSVKPALGTRARWSYDQGVILKGIEELWYTTGDPQYFQYIQHSMDYYVKEDGTVLDYKPEEFNIDHLNNGKVLLTLYQVTGKEKYKKALDQMYRQWLLQPRNELGGLWHKNIYPHQMWLDGLYMGAAFMAQYASVFHDTSAFAEITRQFVLAETYTRDEISGLMYHAWDAKKQQKWANPTTGKSPHIWGRAMGWYGMALVDALDFYPLHETGRDSLLQILNRYVKAIVKVQNSNGLWYDILDAPSDKRNYFETSASAMFSRVLFKAAKKGYIDAGYLQNAQKAYAGIIANYVTDKNGYIELNNTVSVSGLSGTPYRDGSLDYYFSEPIVINDPKGFGALLQAAVQARSFEKLNQLTHPIITLDAFYNNEIKKDTKGNDFRWHYAWEELSNSGIACLGEQFIDKGAILNTLITAPTVAGLKNSKVYIIIDADHVKDNLHPNYMNEREASLIAGWVKQGGTLLVMTNDSANTDLEHTNILLQKFGISATNNSVNMVKGNAFEMGNVFAVKDNGVFSTQLKFHLKEVSALSVKAPATVVATNGTVPVIAKANYGQGKVMVVGDPWLYNEYIDGRKLPKQYQNFEAAQELVNWLIK